jgi:hypothetical protein
LTFWHFWHFRHFSIFWHFFLLGTFLTFLTFWHFDIWHFDILTFLTFLTKISIFQIFFFQQSFPCTMWQTNSVNPPKNFQVSNKRTACFGNLSIATCIAERLKESLYKVFFADGKKYCFLRRHSLRQRIGWSIWDEWGFKNRFKFFSYFCCIFIAQEYLHTFIHTLGPFSM